MPNFNVSSLSILLILSLNFDTMQAFQSSLKRAGSTRTSILKRPMSVLTRMASTEAEAPSGPKVIANEEAYEKVSMDEIVSLCKRRGIIFPSSEIYNGMAGFYDYGPLGSELKKNVKDSWWRHFVTRREDVVGLDSSIIHNPTTWQSSGKNANYFDLYI
jgi:glycyl-tRNA synthetase